MDCFCCLVAILFVFFGFKMYWTDCDGEQMDNEKIDEKTMNVLVSQFMHNRENMRKFRI